MNRYVIALVSLGVFCLHCSSGDSSGKENTGTGTVLTEESFGAAYCDLIKPCCKDYGADECARSAKNRFIGFYAPAAERCLARLRSYASTSTLCGRNAFLIHPECLDMQTVEARGTIALGGNCLQAGITGGCIPPADGNVACVFDNTGAGMCQHPVLAKNEGDACVGNSLDDGRLHRGVQVPKVTPEGAYCDRSIGLTCSFEGANDRPGRCVRARGPGEECDHSTPTRCGAGAYCDFNSATTPRMCNARGGAGTRCYLDDDCVDGTACDLATNTCTPAGDDLLQASWCRPQP